MSWMNKIFGTPAPAPAPAQAAATQTNDPMKMQQPAQTAQSATTAPNGVVPANSSGQSPLENLAKLWEPAKTDPNAQTNESKPITAEQIMEAAGKVDFSKVLSQEELAKVVAGGEGAAVALTSVLNKAMQTAYGHAAFASTKLVEQAVGQAEQKFAEKLPTFINSQSMKNAILQDNPAFANPAVAPIIEMVQRNIAEKFPNATPAEAAKMAKEMMAAAGAVFNPAQQTAEQKTAEVKAKQDDWSTYLG